MHEYRNQKKTLDECEIQAVSSIVTDSGYQLTDVSLEYMLGEKRYPVFSGLSMNLSADSLTVVLGQSGCGKTTLLRLLADLLPPTTGQIKFLKEGKAVVPKVGMVFQESRLFPWLSVAENITIHMEKNPEKAALQKKYLEMMKLTEFAAAYPVQLSGGMAQRIAIARALAYNPDILLMDEPFSALDYFARIQMQDEILRIYQTLGIGIVFVTHNVDEALHLATELLVLKKMAEPVRFDLTSLGDCENRVVKTAVLKNTILDLLKGE